MKQENNNNVKLTEDIILSIKGMVKDPNSNHKYILEDSDFTFGIEDGYWEEPSLDIFLNGMYLTCVEFLHELNNVIFWLTRENLEYEQKHHS